MIDSEKTRGKASRITDSMPTCVAKKDSDLHRRRLPPIGSLQSATALRSVPPFTAWELHLVAGRRSEQLPVPEWAGLTPGSENDLRALRRVLSTIEGGVLCEDMAYCDGPLKKRLAEDQDLDLLTPAREGEGTENPPSGR